MRLSLPLVFLLLVALPLGAQTPGRCVLGEAEAVLDVNDVRATLFNTGALFFGNDVNSGDGYRVPKDTDKQVVLIGSIWVAGRVGGELRAAGARYTRFEFWPGPLGEDAMLPNPDDCSAFDRIFVVSRSDVARYYATGEATADLRDWPYALGAPVLDGDGIAGNYDLAAGDQPAIYGHQTAWWVMNDVGNIHEEMETPPIGLEVQVTAYALVHPYSAINQATLYRFRLINRSEAALEEAYFAWFTEDRLGDDGDDNMGVDTTRSLAYVYNADNQDGNGVGLSYGLNPPAFGYDLLDGAGSHISAFDLAPPHHMPGTATEYYEVMQGRWAGGLPMTTGGYGYEMLGDITIWAFPGDPTAASEQACWSGMNPAPGPPPCAIEEPHRGRDVRQVISSPRFRLAPGEARDFTVALVFARGTDHLDSVRELRRASDLVQTAWEEGLFAPVRVARPEAPPEPAALRLSRVAPNPFTDRLTVRYEVPEALPVRLVLFDVLGREAAVLAEGTVEAGQHEATFEAADLPPGAYVVRFEAAGARRSLAVVKVR